MRRRGFVVLVLAMLSPVLVAADGDAVEAVRVAVLDDPSLEAIDVPAELTPAHIASVLTANGIDAVATAPDAVATDTDAIVNPYGSSYPASSALDVALGAGAGWVNLGGTPFLRPGGATPSAANARSFGFEARGLPADVITGSRPTELGTHRAPHLAPTGAVPGLVLHATDPADERPLQVWEDAALGIEAGPAVLLTVAPHRVVAVGFTGDDSPLARDAPAAAELLVELTTLAADTERPHLTGVAAAYDGDELVVTGSPSRAAAGFAVTGTGRTPAPPRWSPQEPITEWATVRLVDQVTGDLVDLRRVPANPAHVEVVGDQLTLNGAPYLLTGMSSGGSAPPDADAEERAAVARWDIQRMAEVGVTSYRLYSSPSDWLWNAAAEEGLLLAPAVGLGWLFDANPAVIDANLHKARQVGADARERHNVLMLYAGNEFMDHNRDQAIAALARVVDELRAANHHTHLVTYGASHDEPWVLGELPFLDVYSVNCYGATYPIGSPEPGFLHCLLHAKELAAAGRPLVASEWGANTWFVDAANMSARSEVGASVREAEIARAEFVREKWFQIRQVEAVGGFAFQWSDGLGKCLFVQEHCTVTDPVSQPGEERYKPLNHEKYWGFHDAWRNPRLALFTLQQLYHGDERPVGDIPPA